MWANPKNWLIIILLVVAVVIGGLYLWQRNTVVKQAGQINELTTANTALTTQVATYKKNIADMKKTQAAQQQIANDTAALMLQINQMKESKCLGGKDEETLSSVTFYFNSGGLLTASNNSTDGKSVSKTSAADITGWTTKQVIANYLILTDYILKLEKTVNCYEQ